jgi:RNA:NAD 2'-phosphotransferase (TPT1/KptA family)
VARIATAIPQSHRNWLQQNSTNVWADQGPTSLAALTTAVYETRVSASGAHVPVAGSGHVVDTLESLLMPSTIGAISAFAIATNVSMDDLIVPGLTLVVVATLQKLTNPHVSTTQAVKLVQGVKAVAAEMSAATAGTASSQDATDTAHRQLAWARTPISPLSPFTTPFGPSTLWFYASDGTVTDMTHGFQLIRGENSDERIERLTEHVRGVRGHLMARYDGTSITGSMMTGTITVPIHREMSDEYRASGRGLDLSQPDIAAAFIHRIVQRVVGRSGRAKGNIHVENMERSAAVLLPSLLNAVAAFPNVDPFAENNPVALLRRVSLELGERSPDALGEQPAVVWVPQAEEHQQLTEILLRVERENASARIQALRARRNQKDAGVVMVSPVQVAAAVPNLYKAGRRVTKFLRHVAAAVTRLDGYVNISDLLDALSIPGLTVDMVLDICERDRKGRFAVCEEEDGTVWIRANQGHTITCIDPELLMTPIESADDLPICLHGTYNEALQNILRSGSLNRMSRQHIQMAIGLPDDPEVRSGVRQNIDVVIYIDVRKAISLGLRFYRSANNVICCPDQIPIECFLRVVRMMDGSLVDMPAMIRGFSR